MHQIEPLCEPSRMVPDVRTDINNTTIADLRLRKKSVDRSEQVPLVASKRRNLVSDAVVGEDCELIRAGR